MACLADETAQPLQASRMTYPERLSYDPIIRFRTRSLAILRAAGLEAGTSSPCLLRLPSVAAA